MPRLTGWREPRSRIASHYSHGTKATPLCAVLLFSNHPSNLPHRMAKYFLISVFSVHQWQILGCVRSFPRTARAAYVHVVHSVQTEAGSLCNSLLPPVILTLQSPAERTAYPDHTGLNCHTLSLKDPSQIPSRNERSDVTGSGERSAPLPLGVSHDNAFHVFAWDVVPWTIG